MRMLFVSHSSGLMGAERSLLDLVGQAKSGGHDVLVTLPASNLGLLGRELDALGIRYRQVRTVAWMGRWHHSPIGLARLAQSLLATWSHYQAQRVFAPDLVITNTSSIPVGAWAARIRKTPHIWLVRESLASNRQLRSLVPKRFIAGQIARSQGVGVVSSFVGQQLVELLRVPVPFSIVSPSLPVKAHVEEMPPGPGIRLLLAGFISPEKGQADAIRALKVCRDAGFEVTLTIAGTGSFSYLARLRFSAIRLRTSKFISYVGWKNDLASCLASSHAVLMTSRNEAYGRVTVEALRNSRPVLGYAAGATSEIIGTGAGLLCPPGYRNLAEVILEFCKLSPQEREAFGSRARERSLELCRTSTQYEAFVRLAKSVTHHA